MSNWTASEGLFESWDGTELFYRAWKPEVSSTRALIFLHRGHEHSGRIAQQVRDFDLGELWAFAWDCRGHGRSPGERGYAENFYDHVRDLNTFVEHVTREYGVPVENMALVANSIGSVTAATWVHDFAPRIRALVLAAPGFRVRLYIPFAVPLLRLLQKLKGKAFISSYVKSKMLTHDPDQMKAYDEDELITRNIAVNILLGLHDISTRIMADAGAIVAPTLILVAGTDWVVKNSAQHSFYKRLSSRVKELEVYPGFFHAILYEKERLKPITKAREFIREAFQHDIDRSFLLDADQTGYTRQEYDELKGPAPIGKSVLFGLQRTAMRTVGRLSDGVRLGLRTGFDSGESLDYVYRNEARGITPVGRIIDRSYLNAVGWRAMRERQANLETCLRESIRRISESGEPLLIIDTAAGCGRYVLDVLRDAEIGNASALLLDRDGASLAAGRRLSDSLGLDRVTFQQGDAFATEAILAVEPPPNIAIVSGFYELFPDNQRILASLQGLAGVLAPGGHLIYTCQPWHPQLEMIARTCNNSDGAPWVMRRRTQAEMDELVRSVGLEKIEMRIDSFGISTVAVARKPESS